MANCTIFFVTVKNSTSIFKINAQFSGFTLLELLIALAIFAVMAVMAYSGLKTVLDARIQIQQHADQLADLQMTFTWLGRDIQQYIDREIRNEFGDKEPSLKGTASELELTRTGWRNPARQKRSHLQRVAYNLSDGKLWRFYWWTLDRAQDSEANKIDLLNGVESLNFRFLDNHLKWHEQWPPSDFLNTELSNENTSMLKAVEVTLIVLEWGTLTRLFDVAETWNLKDENKEELP